MQVRQLNRGTYDVFLGVGFDNWSRVRKFHWGVKVVDGNRLPKDAIIAIEEAIINNPHGNVDNV